MPSTGYLKVVKATFIVLFWNQSPLPAENATLPSTRGTGF